MSNGKSTPQIFILIGCCLILTGLIITYPKPTQAEIATPKDWIGLFPTVAADGKTNTVTSSNATFIDGHMWVYANSCTQTAGANPKLTDPTGCSFAFSSTPTSGNYEFRLYANDQETSAALIAKSNTLSAAAASPTPGPAVNCPTQTAYPRVQDGLITASGTSNNFGTPTGACVIDPKAPFAPFKIPTYDDLKSLYFTQSKAAKMTNAGTSLAATADNTVYNYNNTSTDITTGTYSYSGTAVIFIDGSIYINGNVIGPADKGLVLVVRNNVNIDKLVRRVDAVIIAGGPIYTAGVGCATSAVPADDLTVNGSLISLSTASPIRLCRSLADNSAAAEKIVWQPKYLVILRNLLFDTYQKWSEIQ